MNNIEVEPIGDKFKTRPVWSVMIPTFNRDEFLRQAIESVLQQDPGAGKMEIWVVDDCSSEGNPEGIVKELGKGRIQFFKQPKNVGQLNNFETCLNLSKGQLIHLLHSDDFVHPGFYQKLENPMLSDKSIGAAFTRHHSVDKNNVVLSTSEEILENPGILPNFMYSIASKQSIQTPSIVVKRKVYEKLGGFNKKLKGSEDWEMWIRIACHYNFYYEPAILASYRIHEKSNSGDSNLTGRFVDDAVACIKIYSAYLPVKASEKRIIIRNAKSYFLEYAFYMSKKYETELKDDKSALLILYKSFYLTYNFSSFIRVLRKIKKKFRQ